WMCQSYLDNALGLPYCAQVDLRDESRLHHLQCMPEAQELLSSRVVGQCIHWWGVHLVRHARCVS
ncbi:hypothetical protein RZ737_004796, partial [Escherichia coli]|nr:hypothetical protein [Escherichia coli]